MNLVLWYLLGLTSSKLVDIIPDPYFTSLTDWQTSPFLKICRNCTSIPSVGPSVPNGLYFFEENSYYSSNFVELYTSVTIPSGVDLATLYFAAQVRNGQTFTLTVSLLDYSWAYTVGSLAKARGIYTNFSNAISFPPASEHRSEILKFVVAYVASDSEDYLSINQAHLFCDTSQSQTDWLKIILFTVLGLLALVGIIILLIKCYVRRRESDSYSKL